MRSSGTPRAEDGEPPASEWSGFEGKVSRRRLLSKAGVAAAGLVVAGALTQRDIREAEAAQVIGDSNIEFRGGVEGTNNAPFGYGVMGRATDGWGVDGQADRAGVRGGNHKGIGVQGTGPTGVSGFGDGQLGSGLTGVGVKGYGEIGVHGESSTAGQNGVWGRHTNQGSGIFGEGRVGVLGISSENGWNGVWGRHTANGRAVAGDSAQGVGVDGVSTSGYGGQFKGGKAQLRFVPAGTTGKPTGTHTKGEIFMDSAGTLFICVASSTSTAAARWKKLSAVAV
jgi:hypothetical protein